MTRTTTTTTSVSSRGPLRSPRPAGRHARRLGLLAGLLAAALVAVSTVDPAVAEPDGSSTGPAVTQPRTGTSSPFVAASDDTPVAQRGQAARSPAPGPATTRTVTEASFAAASTVAAAGCPLPAVVCDIGGLLIAASGAGWVADEIGQALQDAALAPFAAMTLAFANAAVRVLGWVADEFLVRSTVDLSDGQLDTILWITSGLASIVAVLLLVWAAGSTAWSGDGSRLATALVGLAKMIVITAMIVVVTQTALTASDDITSFIVDFTLGKGGLRAALNNMFASADPVTDVAMLLVIALIALMAGLVIMLEMIFRHAAIVIVVACAPITAAGSILEATSSWWTRARNALIALILMKPVIALVFAVGFTSLSYAHDPYAILAGLLTVVLAAFAWPVLARFVTFTTVGGGSGMMAGIAAAAGYSLGRRSMGGHGQSAASFSRDAEAEADATVDGQASTAMSRATGTARAVTSGHAPQEAAGRTSAANAAGNVARTPARAGGTAGAVTAGALAAIQVGAIVLDHLEATAANTAAHADLGPPAHPHSTYWAAHGLAGYGVGRISAGGQPEDLPTGTGGPQPEPSPNSPPPPVDEDT